VQRCFIIPQRPQKDAEEENICQQALQTGFYNREGAFESGCMVACWLGESEFHHLHILAIGIS
jgi:hypothetical protein